MPRLRKLRPSWPSKRSQAPVQPLIILLLGIFAAAIYRYCVSDAKDPFKCTALLDHGRWLDIQPDAYYPHAFQHWQPPGCLMHDYGSPDIEHCLSGKRIVLAGDTTTRQIFWAVARKMDLGGARKEMAKPDQHHDIVFERGHVKVEFIWDPFLNSTRLREELIAYHPTGLPPKAEESEAKGNESAALLYIGGGHFFARHIDLNPQHAFKDAMDNVVPFMANAKEEQSSALASSVANQDGSSNFLLLAPVEVPWYEHLSPSRRPRITPDVIDGMNSYMHQLSTFQDADILWSFARMTDGYKPAYQESGLHVIESVASTRANILLNLRCNAKAAGSYGKGGPYDRTCCSNYRSPGWVQLLGLLTGLVVLPCMLVFPSLESWISPICGRKTLTALLALALSACFCFYTDRTQLFNKIHTRFYLSEFARVGTLLGVVGLLTVRRINPFRSQQSESRALLPESENSFLSPHQIDEWRGWILAFLLTYSFTNAQKVLWIYELKQLLTGTLLFVLAFSQTSHLYMTGDYSLRRIPYVLIRYNALCCALTYAMKSSYLLYRFPPLFSFWTLIIFCTMKIQHYRNGSLTFVLGKVLGSMLFTWSCMKFEFILNAISTILRVTSRIDWSADDWRPVVAHDLWTPFVGMACAALAVHISAGPIPNLERDTSLMILIRQYFTFFQTVLVLASILIMPSFWALVGLSPSPGDYDWWHPMISWVAILALVILRNCTSFLRTHTSLLFSWLGRFYLEAYVLHHHIWMAGDRQGLLSIGVTNQWLESALLAILFLWTSQAAGHAVDVFAAFVVDGPDETTTASGKRVVSPFPDRTSEDSSVELPRIRRRGDSNLSVEMGRRSGYETSSSRASTSAQLQHGGWRGRFVSRWKSSLQFRLGVLLWILWAFNVAYL